MGKVEKKELSNYLKRLKEDREGHKSNYEFFYEVDGRKFEDFLYLVEKLLQKKDD